MWGVRETSADIQGAPLSVVGVGNLSGDAVAAGMLLSGRIRLAGPLDRLRVFVAPDAAAASFRKRRHLFRLAPPKLVRLQREGDVRRRRRFQAQALAITATPQMTAPFGITADGVRLGELIRGMPDAEVDLLWLSASGTYAKATGESHADAGASSATSGQVVSAFVSARGDGLNFSDQSASSRVSCGIVGRSS